MAVKNTIIAGDYKGYIDFKNKREGLFIYGTFGFGKKKFINKSTVESYEVVGEEQHRSFGSSVARGVAGAALFGGVGAIAGAASGKNKTHHTVSIVFKDGTKCLCELDDFMYQNLVAIMY